MGERGPVPKRSSERRRRNKDSVVETVELKGLGPVPVPESDPAWHPRAREWYESLADSGQSKYFEPSDWQAARVLADALTKCLRMKRFSAVLFASVWAGMADLLTTEASRRRVRMEIERDLAGDLEESARVVAIASYRKAVGA